MHTMKPECQEGFIPLMGFSVGWSCTPAINLSEVVKSPKP
jgi:hypothetical protein